MYLKNNDSPVSKKQRSSKLTGKFIELLLNLHKELSKIEKLKNKDNCIKKTTKENELFHSPMINELPGMVYCCRNDNKWTMEFVSKECRNLTGYKPLDLIINNKISYEEIIHPEDRKMVRNDVKKSLKKSKQFNLKYRIITADKEIKWVSEIGQSLPIPGTNLDMLQGFIIDITSGKLIEEALKESEEKYRILFDTSPVGIATLDNKGVVTNVNNIILDLTGLKRKDITGRHFTELKFVSEKDIPEYIKIFKKFILKKKIKPFTIKWKRKDGKYFTVEVRTSVIKKKNKISGIQLIVTDITGRIKIEEKLRESKEFNKSILDNSPSPIYVMNPDKTMEYVNPAFEKLTGFSASEIIGNRPPRPYWIKGFEKKYLSNLDHFLKKGIGNLELPFVNKRGEKFWVLVTLRPVKNQGQVKYLLGNFIDITERKKAFEMLERALNDTISTLASIVETRDPYTAGHQKGVTLLSKKIAKILKLGDEKIKFIEIAARLHDIGKINIPPSILSKPGKLSEIEFNIVKTHPQVGSDIIKKINFHYPVSRIILQHHEREDGSGYPVGLKGKYIMIEAKILGVADVVEAMSSHRPYRAALGIRSAINEIKKNKGKLYNRRVVDACVSIISNKNFSFDR